MSRTLSRWQAILLGLVVGLGSILGGFGVFLVGSRVWPGRNDLHVQVGFPEIRGVEVGTRVRIQGIDAGEVVEITAPNEPDEPVLLRLRIQGQYRHLVRTASTVRILSEGMLGGKVVEVRPPAGKPGEPPLDLSPAGEGVLLASESSPELSDVVGQVGIALDGVQKGQGTLGRLVKDPQAYEALVTLLRSSNEAVDRSKDTMNAIQRDAEAIKKVPILGRYVEDPLAILVRPNCERNRRIFAETDLFEPGRAVLTTAGRDRLNGLAPWLEGLKHKGSEVVVVSFADPKKAEVQAANGITRQQSETVVNFLKSNHRIHKMGWFSSRKVIPLGMGTSAPPTPEPEPLPAARLEVVVYVPQV